MPKFVLLAAPPIHAQIPRAMKESVVALWTHVEQKHEKEFKTLWPMEEKAFQARHAQSTGMKQTMLQTTIETNSIPTKRAHDNVYVPHGRPCTQVLAWCRIYSTQFASGFAAAMSPFWWWKTQPSEMSFTSVGKHVLFFLCIAPSKHLQLFR